MRRSKEIYLLTAVLVVQVGLLTAAAPAVMVWFTTGNQGVDPATNYLGTADASPLVVKTDATTAFTVGVDQSVAFEGDIAVDGNVDVTGDVDGVDVSELADALDARLGLGGEPVALELERELGGSQYIVPDGMALVVEHILFNDTWDAGADLLRVFFQHSVNPSGQVWSTTFDSGSAINTLDMPITIPEGLVVSVPINDDGGQKAFLYGRLVQVGGG